MVKRIEGETALARFGALRVFPDTGGTEQTALSVYGFARDGLEPIRTNNPLISGTLVSRRCKYRLRVI
jgi:hypothetical protein